MSSSWSEIRSRAGNDPLIETISDLQLKSNLNEALENIITSDKISPIRILRSKVEVYDKDMMTGYTRSRNTDRTYYMPKEPDGDHLRLQLRFDSACDVLTDYSMMGNQAKVEFEDELPVLLKGTEDDSITAGDIVTVIDGKTQYYRIKNNPAVSIKKMVLSGEPGVTIIYRHYPLFIKNELESGNMQRATPFYFIENDQVEYACKCQIDDKGFIYFFFRYQFIDYIVKSTVSHIAEPPVSDYKAPDYSPNDYDSAEHYYNVPFPTPYIDLAFEFNFTTKAISLFKNGVPIAVTTTAVTIVPPPPTPIFPLSKADPPPPPPVPEPYFLPFEKVYEQLSATSYEQINAITTTEQIPIYHVNGSPPQTDPIERIYQVKPPPESRYKHLNPDESSGLINYNPIIPPLGNSVKWHGVNPYSSAKIYIIFDGAAWETITTPYSKQNLIDKLTAVVNSTYFDHLIQYNCRKPREWRFVTNNFMSMPDNYTQEDVKILIEDCKTRDLVNGHIPTERHHVYMVIGGPNKQFTSTIAGSTGTRAAYWTNNNDIANTVTLRAVAMYQTNIDYLTSKILGLIILMITDPYKNPATLERGWRMTAEDNGVSRVPGEDPNLPSSNPVLINNVLVDPYWSAVENKGVPPPEAPSWVSCQADTVWNEATQFCVGKTTTTSPTTTAGTSLAKISTSDSSSAVLRKNSADNEIVGNIILSNQDDFGIAVVGKSINQFIVQLRGESSPTGMMFGRVWDNNGKVKATIGEYDSSQVGDSWTPITFTGKGSATLQVGDRIGVEYKTGTTSDIIKVRRKSNNINDGSVCQATLDYGDDPDQWSFNKSYQVGMEVFSGGGGGGTGPIQEDNFYADIAIANNSPDCGWYVGELIGTGSNCVSKIATLLEMMLWRNSVASSGKYIVALWDREMKWKKTFMEGNVVDLPTSIPYNYNIVWQDINNDVPFTDNDSLIIQVSGVEHPAKVFTMTNQDFRGEMAGGHQVPNPDQTPLFKPPKIPEFSSTSIMKDWGGNRISSATLHHIFWGKDWETRESPFSKDDIISSQRIFVQHKFYDANMQYKSKRPKMGRSVVNTTYPPYDNFSGEDLFNVVVDSIKRGLVPPQTADNKQIYMIVPSRGKDPDRATGEGAGGWHNFGTMPGETTTSQLNPNELVYIIFGWSRHYDLGGINHVLIHEWEEAITDPRPTWATLGIYSRITGGAAANRGNAGEISDVCVGVRGHDWGTDTYHGVQCNPYWSNLDVKDGDGCVMPDSKPSWIACEEGYTWNDTTQQCEKRPPGTIMEGGSYDNDYDGENSYIVHTNLPEQLAIFDRTVDLAMRVRIGGGEFIGYIELNNRRQRVGIKAKEFGSAFVGKIPTKFEFKVRRVGPQLPPSNLICVIRDALGVLQAHFGTFDATLINLTDTPVVFTDQQSTYAISIGDTISLEYNKATATNYIMVRTAKGSLNAGDARKTMLFESVMPSLWITYTLHDMDLAGTVYTGGRKDLAARPMRGVRVATEQSVLFGKVITEVRVKLKGTGLLPLGHNIRVKIIRGVDKVVMKTLGLLDFNSISTTNFIEYYFVETDNTYRMVVGDMVGIEFNHGNSGINFLQIRTSTGDVYDGGNTIMFEFNGSRYLDVVGKDLSGSISVGGYTVYPDLAVPTPIPPFHYAHEWFIGAATTPDSEALVDPSTLKPLPNSHYNAICKEFRIYDQLLTENQLSYYYENRFTISPIPKGRIEVVGHDISPFSTS